MFKQWRVPTRQFFSTFHVGVREILAIGDGDRHVTGVCAAGVSVIAIEMGWDGLAVG
jgi:hypothetical protein